MSTTAPIEMSTDHASALICAADELRRTARALASPRPAGPSYAALEHAESLCSSAARLEELYNRWAVNVRLGVGREVEA